MIKIKYMVKSIIIKMKKKNFVKKAIYMIILKMVLIIEKKMIIMIKIYIIIKIIFLKKNQKILSMNQV